jgi:hypothetical protein
VDCDVIYIFNSNVIKAILILYVGTRAEKIIQLFDLNQSKEILRINIPQDNSALICKLEDQFVCWASQPKFQWLICANPTRQCGQLN